MGGPVSSAGKKVKKETKRVVDDVKDEAKRTVGKGASSLGLTPDIPEPPAASEVPTDVPKGPEDVPTPGETSEQKRKRQRLAATSQKTQGRANTILTGSGGILDEPSISRRTLLGA